MTIENFNNLDYSQKVEVICDANKITEKIEGEANCQLFQINNFFVEAKTSLEGKFKRFFTAYSLKELPVDYAGELLSIPIVLLDNKTAEKNPEKLNAENKKKLPLQTQK